MTANGTMPVRTKAVQEKRQMPPKKRNVSRVEVRLDAETLDALQALIERYGNRLTQSEIIRNAILQMAASDKKTNKKTT